MKTDYLRDRAAIQVEISRLRRIEAKAGRSAQQAVARRIRELEIQLRGYLAIPGSKPTASSSNFKQ